MKTSAVSCPPGPAPWVRTPASVGAGASGAAVGGSRLADGLAHAERPENRLVAAPLRVFMTRVVPAVAWVTRRDGAALMQFYWDTIDQCVPPETILAVLRKTGFVDVKLRRTYLMINEYTPTRPLK